MSHTKQQNSAAQWPHESREVGVETETESLSLFQIVPPVEDPSSEQWLKLLERSGSLSFWNRPEEDIYTENDGEPL